MTTKVSTPRPIQCLAGVRPLTEGTALTTQHFVSALNVVFTDGLPEKMAGWKKAAFDYSNAIVGKARSIMSTVLNGVTIFMIGTNSRLYSLLGTRLTNITPLQTSTIAIANSLTTLYGALANNPITTTNGSPSVVVADTSASRWRVGDSYTLSGVPGGGVNGIPAANLNRTTGVRAVGVNTITLNAGSNATSSGAGGSNAVVRSSGIIQVTKAAHGEADGNRIKITGAADSAGILAASINLEFIIRVTGVNTYDVVTAGLATSSVAAAGGGGTVYQQQIAAGAADQHYGVGYGMGKYGLGLYGTGLVSSTAMTLVQTWFLSAERFSNVLLSTPGNQSGLYEWDGNVAAAPVLVSGAPTAINYAFVSDNIAVTLGAGGVENRIQTSDQGNRAQWVASSTNQVFQDDIEGAGRFLSHAHVNGINLLFTDSKTYTFQYIGGIAVWAIAEKDVSVGLIGPMARCVVNGVAYWVGQNNIYMWQGGNIAVVPSNDSPQTTLFKYIFQNINRAQSSKIFMWWNAVTNTIWIHYASKGANECDSVAMLNLNDLSWTPNTMSRSAAESPFISLGNPHLADSNGNLFSHENGVDDDVNPMAWSIQTPDLVNGKNNATIVSFVPDSLQEGGIAVEVKGRKFPQSKNLTFDSVYSVDPDTERVPTASSARIWNYTISGSVLGQTWRMGAWVEEIQEGAGN